MSNIITNRDILVNKDLIEHVLNHQWVDANVRLPKEHFNDGYQLVFIIRQINDDTMIYETDYIKNGEWELSKGKAGKVTYWMNIPKITPVKNIYTEKMKYNFRQEVKKVLEEEGEKWLAALNGDIKRDTDSIRNQATLCNIMENE